jgi:transposase
MTKKIKATTIKKNAKAATQPKKKGFERKKVVAAYEREGSYEKAAKKLGCSAATVKYHVRKARQESEMTSAFTY